MAAPALHLASQTEPAKLLGSEPDSGTQQQPQGDEGDQPLPVHRSTKITSAVVSPEAPKDKGSALLRSLKKNDRAL